MTEPKPTEPTRWAGLKRPSAREYAARFADLASSGAEVHGEAQFATGLVGPGSTVLDAGCGTGRVAIRLTQLGYDCVGVDADRAMLEQAQLEQAQPEQADSAPKPCWALGDLSDRRTWRRLAGDAQLPGWIHGGADLVIAAGNVVPLLAPGSLLAAIETLAASLSPSGLLVSGFGLDSAHLPAGCPVTPLLEYDQACLAAGLQLNQRFASWDKDPYLVGDNGSGNPARPGYAVSVHAGYSAGTALG